MYARIDNKKIRGYITLFETAVVDKETQEIVVTLRQEVQNYLLT